MVTSVYIQFYSKETDKLVCDYGWCTASKANVLRDSVRVTYMAIVDSRKDISC